MWVGAHLIQIVISLATVTVELAKRTTGRLGRPASAVKAGQSFGEERHVITTWRPQWENELKLSVSRESNEDQKINLGTAQTTRGTCCGCIRDNFNSAQKRNNKIQRHCSLRNEPSP